MKSDITSGDKYGPAMEIVDREEAVKYFEECVEHAMGHGYSREEATEIEKSNLGYYAGYYDHSTRIRVQELFEGIHPIFGSTEKGAPTPNEAFEAGKKLADA